MNMKKLIVKKLALILILTLTLVSCESNINSTSSSDHEQNLFIFAPKDVTIPAKAFLKNAQTKIQTNNYSEALSVALSSENPPTLFMLENAEDVNNFKNHIEELSGENWVNNASPNTLLTLNGKVYTMPATLRGVGIVYNTEILEYAGINPENLNSPDRLLSTVQILSEKIKNGGFSETFPDLRAVFSIDEDFDDNFEKVTKTASQNTDILKSLIESYAIKDENALENRKSIMTLSDTDTYTSKSFDILPLCIKDEIEYKVLIETPLMWAVNKNASFEDKKTAKEFLGWLYTKEGREHLIALGFINPITNLDTTDADIEQKMPPIHKTLKILTDTAQTSKIPD